MHNFSQNGGVHFVRRMDDGPWTGYVSCILLSMISFWPAKKSLWIRTLYQYNAIIQIQRSMKLSIMSNIWRFSLIFIQLKWNMKYRKRLGLNLLCEKEVFVVVWTIHTTPGESANLNFWLSCQSSEPKVRICLASRRCVYLIEIAYNIYWYLQRNNRNSVW